MTKTGKHVLRAGVVVAVVAGTPAASGAIHGHRAAAAKSLAHGATAYVLNVDTVTPIRTATNTPGKPIKVGNEPLAIAITPDGKTPT